jgi:hypothetical protein
MLRIAITLFTLCLFTQAAYADIDGKPLEAIEKKIAAEESLCRNILDADQYVEGERYIGREVIEMAGKNKEKVKKIVYICGIIDPLFQGKGDAKYVNAVIVNKSGLNFSVSKLKSFVDKYQVNSRVIMHIVIDPETLLNELIKE